jgi:hypothetical protein
MLSKQNFIMNEARRLADLEGVPVSTVHEYAARKTLNETDPSVQAALIRKEESANRTGEALKAKLAGVLATAQKDFLFTPEGMKASKAKTSEEKAAAATAWKNYVARMSPDQLGEATKEQLVGAGGAGTAGVTRLQFDAAGKQI